MNIFARIANILQSDMVHIDIGALNLYCILVEPPAIKSMNMLCIPSVQSAICQALVFSSIIKKYCIS